MISRPIIPARVQRPLRRAATALLALAAIAFAGAGPGHPVGRSGWKPGASTAGGIVSIPAAEPAFSAPSDNPSLPAWVDIFNPSFTGTASGTSAIARITAQANRGNAVAVAGASFTGDEAIKIYGQTVSGNGALVTATQLELNGNRMAVALPLSLPAGSSMYIAWPSNSTGYGAPVLINATEAWWLQSSSTGNDRATSGDTVSVYGRNLSGPSNNCYVYLQPYAGTGASCTVTSVNPYRVQFTLPGGLIAESTSASSNTPSLGSHTFTTQAGLSWAANQGISCTAGSRTIVGTVTSYSGTTLVMNCTSFIGSGSSSSWTLNPTYQVWLHNGHGGKYGWSRCLQDVTIRAATDYTNYTYTMPAPTGGDDTANFNTAVANLGSHGNYGTIQLATGTYLLASTPSQIPGADFFKGVRILGNGRSNTFVKPTGTTSRQFFLDMDNGTQLEGVTVDLSGHTEITQSCIRGSRLVNCDVIAKLASPATSIAPIGKYVLMTGCNVTGPGYADGSQTSGIFDSDNWYMTNGSNSAIIGSDTRNVSVTNNTFQTSTTSSGRATTFQIVGQAIFNMYLAGNTTTSLGPTGNNQNIGEQFNFDNALGTQSALVTSAAVSGGATTLTLASLTGDYAGRDAFITDGKGICQHAIIASTNFGSSGTTLTLDRQLAVAPNSTSRCNIVATDSRIVLYKNTQQGTGNWTGTASAPFTMFSGGTDFIVDGNTCSNFNYAFQCWSRATSNGLTDNCSVPLLFNLIQNNTVTSTTNGTRLIDGRADASETSTFEGVVFRNNTVTGVVNADVYDDSLGGNTSDLVIFDGETYHDAPTGYFASHVATPSPTVNITFNNSSISLGTATFSGSKSSAFPGGDTVSAAGYNYNGTSPFSGFQSDH